MLFLSPLLFATFGAAWDCRIPNPYKSSYSQAPPHLDLNALANRNYYYTDSQTLSWWQFSVCSDIHGPKKPHNTSFPCSNKLPPTATSALRQDSSQKCEYIAHFDPNTFASSARYFLDLDGRCGVRVAFRNGQTGHCEGGAQQMEYEFVCDIHAHEPTIETVEEFALCQYQATIRTKHACPNIDPSHPGCPHHHPLGEVRDSMQLYRNSTFATDNETLVYAQGLRCDKTPCVPMNLTLDKYWPVPKAGSPIVPARKPAYILAHGGGNSGGSKDQACFYKSAQFFASRGFVAFNINYRLKGMKGNFPPSGPPGPPAPQVGTALVSHIERQWYFSPHPEHNSKGENYVGPLLIEIHGVPDNKLCITAHNTGEGLASSVTLSLEQCDLGASQNFSFTMLIHPQNIRHPASGLCLDFPGMDKPKADVPLGLSACGERRWQLGFSGALFTTVHGTIVSVAPKASMLGWNPSWPSGYPAVRDMKAAVRFVRANADKFGVDPSRIVASGGSAGATNALAAGVVFESDYKSEFTVEQDPTLASTHLEVNSSVQVVVAHWSSNGEVELAREHDPQNRTRYSTSNAAVIEFHGDKDTTIPIDRALAVQAQYARTGVPYELHVLTGCGHGAWCWNGTLGRCGCKDGVQGYDDTMDTIALPFVAKHLGLPLV